MKDKKCLEILTSLEEKLPEGILFLVFHIPFLKIFFLIFRLSWPTNFEITAWDYTSFMYNYAETSRLDKKEVEARHRRFSGELLGCYLCCDYTIYHFSPDWKVFCNGFVNQAYIIGVGDNISTVTYYLIVLDTIIYRTENIIKAIDIAFKMQFVLYIGYPQESHLVWLFIQNYFYDIKLQNDKQATAVTCLIRDLK